MAPPKKKSLQDVLRERRAAAPLLSAPRAAGARSEPPAGGGRAGSRRPRGALASGAHRGRRGREARARPSTPPSSHRAGLRTWRASTGRAAPRRSGRRRLPAKSHGCGKSEGLQAHLLTHDALGEEVVGRDLMTLCEGCLRRAVKLEQERGRAGDARRAEGARSRAAALRRRGDRRAEGEAQPSARPSPSIEG